MFKRVNRVFLAAALLTASVVPTATVQAQGSLANVDGFDLIQAGNICVFISTFTNKDVPGSFMVGVALSKDSQESSLSFKIEKPFEDTEKSRLFDVYILNDEDMNTDYGSVRFVGVDAEPGTQYVGALPATFVDDLTEFPIIGVMDGDVILVAFKVPTNDPAFLSELKECANGL